MHGRHDGDDASTKTLEEVVSKDSKATAAARVYNINIGVFILSIKLNTIDFDMDLQGST